MTALANEYTGLHHSELSELKEAPCVCVCYLNRFLTLVLA